jgi:hypothetical protein
MTSRITLDGYDSLKRINLDKNLPKGIYYLGIINPAIEKQTIAILIN